jgi:outer membrane lipoprotein-sorting protein
MRDRRLLGLLAAILSTVPAAGTWAETPEERGLAIAREADARDSGFGDWTARVLMVLRDAGGRESRRDMRVSVLEMSGDGDRSLIVFDRPPDIEDTALLTHAHKSGEDDQWLYLPSIARVKRISAANKSGPFVGSEFAYEDMVNQEVEKFTYRYLGDEACGALACFVVERYPVDRNSGYSRQVVWLDQGEYRVQRIDFYDRKESLLKTFTALGYRTYAQRFWRAETMTMANHQSGKSTELTWSDYRFGTGLGEGDFTQSALTRED